MKRETIFRLKPSPSILISTTMFGLLATLCFAVFATGVNTEGSASPDGHFDLWVRDSSNGYGVAGMLKAHGNGGALTLKTSQVNDTGHLDLKLPQGSYEIEVTAPGYRSIKTRLVAEAGKSWPITVWLDPQRLPAEIDPAAVKSKMVQGTAMLHGHIVDTTTGKPISGVLVSLVKAGLQAYSDSRGYFTLYPPVKPAMAESLPEMDDLKFESPGYKTNLLTNTPLTESDTHFIVEMEPGEGVKKSDDTPKLMRGEEEQKQAQLPPEDESEKEAEPGKPTDERTSKAMALPRGAKAASLVEAPPPSIRVGFTCSCASCSSVQVMSLETYTKRGLNDEWIASWNAHSLRSGAIAYRSYGSYYVYHPRSPNYDICSTTCCQVNDADTSASTNSAVEYTAGILLERNGSVFRSEYSAENNNYNCGVAGCSNGSCTCGDGNAGSPGTNWPCISDPVDAGRNCFGHGRGMCQWGTQRWALQGQTWNWIEDHYYNNNGAPGGLRSAYMTSPLDISYAIPYPDVVTVKETFTIYVGGNNYAELEHSQVMIGASLYSPASGYISDPASDVKVTLYPGGNDVWRQFSVPWWVPADTYDLIVALWLDIDEDSAITGADLPLIWYVYPSTVTVQ